MGLKVPPDDIPLPSSLLSLVSSSHWLRVHLISVYVLMNTRNGAGPSTDPEGHHSCQNSSQEMPLRVLGEAPCSTQHWGGQSGSAKHGDVEEGSVKGAARPGPRSSSPDTGSGESTAKPEQLSSPQWHCQEKPLVQGTEQHQTVVQTWSICLTCAASECLWK